MLYLYHRHLLVACRSALADQAVALHCLPVRCLASALGASTSPHLDWLATSDYSPTDQAFRANLVMDLCCRLPLSTLHHRIETVYLGDLLRLWVQPDTIIICSLGFLSAVESTPDTTSGVEFYQACDSFSGQTDFRMTYTTGKARVPVV